MSDNAPLTIDLSKMRTTQEQPTNGLRWRGGVLEQAYLIMAYEGGTLTERRIEWRPVETVVE
jgi:hypothetical protein